MQLPSSTGIAHRVAQEPPFAFLFLLPERSWCQGQSQCHSEVVSQPRPGGVRAGTLAQAVTSGCWWENREEGCFAPSGNPGTGRKFWCLWETWTCPGDRLLSSDEFVRLPYFKGESAVNKQTSVQQVNQMVPNSLITIGFLHQFSFSNGDSSLWSALLKLCHLANLSTLTDSFFSIWNMATFLKRKFLILISLHMRDGSKWVGCFLKCVFWAISFQTSFPFLVNLNGWAPQPLRW